MAAEKLCFKDYISCKDDVKLSKTRKMVNRKRKDGSSKNVYGWAGYGPPPNISGAPAAGGTAAGSPGAGGGAAESYQGHNKMRFLQFMNEEDWADDESGFDEVEYDNNQLELQVMQMLDNGMTPEDIADELGITPEDVAYIMSAYGDRGPQEDDEEDDDLEWGDYEEPEYNNAFNSFARNKERGEEIDDFMSGADAEEFDPDARQFDEFDPDELVNRYYPDGDEEDLEWGDYEPRTVGSISDPDYDEDAAFADEYGFDDEMNREMGVPGDDEDEEDIEQDQPNHFDIEDEDPESDEYDDEYGDYDEFEAGGWTVRRIDDEEDDPRLEVEDQYDDEDSDEVKSAGPITLDHLRNASKRSFSSFMNGEEDYEYAEDAETPSKKDQARALYRAMSNGKYSRKDIINAFNQRLGLSPESSTAYYERIAREYGETEQQGAGAEKTGLPAGAGMGNQTAMGMPGGTASMTQQEPEYQEPQEWEDPHRQGVIRTVANAHLVYKRQADDGSFEELWIYKQGDNFKDSLNIRHDILAGTDIPPNKTTSPDRSQKAETWSVGDVQFIEITGLPN